MPQSIKAILHHSAQPLGKDRKKSAVNRAISDTGPIVEILSYGPRVPATLPVVSSDWDFQYTCEDRSRRSPA